MCSGPKPMVFSQLREALSTHFCKECPIWSGGLERIVIFGNLQRLQRAVFIQDIFFWGLDWSLSSECPDVYQCHIPVLNFFFPFPQLYPTFMSAWSLFTPLPLACSPWMSGVSPCLWFLTRVIWKSRFFWLCFAFAFFLNSIADCFGHLQANITEAQSSGALDCVRMSDPLLSILLLLETIVTGMKLPWDFHSVSGKL